MKDGVSHEVSLEALKFAKKYEALVTALAERNGRLEEQVKMQGKAPGSAPMAPSAQVVPTFAGVVAGTAAPAAVVR